MVIPTRKKLEVWTSKSERPMYLVGSLVAGIVIISFHPAPTALPFTWASYRGAIPDTNFLEVWICKWQKPMHLIGCLGISTIISGFHPAWQCLSHDHLTKANSAHSSIIVMCLLPKVLTLIKLLTVQHYKWRFKKHSNHLVASNPEQKQTWIEPYKV